MITDENDGTEGTEETTENNDLKDGQENQDNQDNEETAPPENTTEGPGKIFYKDEEITVDDLIAKCNTLEEENTKLKEEKGELSEDLAKAEKALEVPGDKNQIQQLTDKVTAEKERANTKETEKKRAEQALRALRLDVKKTVDDLLKRNKIK